MRVTRIKTLKKAISHAEKRGKSDHSGKTHAWKKVPAELNKLLENKEREPEAEEESSEIMRDFLSQYHLDGTKVLDAICVKELCRLTMEHGGREDYYMYLKHQTFLELNEESNYFSRNREKLDPMESFIWLGRDGYVLPFEEIHDREKFLER